MQESLDRLLAGYKTFQDKYTAGDNSLMHQLAREGQNPEVMVVACSDSRVDPALILQCNPGDLFMVRNVANIVPPFEDDEGHHGVSAALEFGICYLKVKHLVILGHSQCGGIDSLLNQEKLQQNDFISNWVSILQEPHDKAINATEFGQQALLQSAKNCLTFPWIANKVTAVELQLHLWYFDIEKGSIEAYAEEKEQFQPLEDQLSVVKK